MQTRAEISTLHHRIQTTFIYVTHDQIEAMTMATRIAVVNKGLLQQLDTPQNLYSHPANQFVAGFIGSPAMNFIDGKLRKDDSQLYIDTQDFVVKLPESSASHFFPYAGKEVIFGIRPEDIYNPAFVPTGIHAEPMEATIDVIELMGYETMVHINSGHNNFVARVDPRTSFNVGEKVQLVLNMDNIHLFDPGIDRENPPSIN